MDIVVDFDGTCLTHEFPSLGKDIGAIPVLKKIVGKGHNLILFTMRSDGQKEQIINGYKMHKGDFLTQAVNWFKENDIPLYGIQTNPRQKSWTSSPKAYGQLIIDDASIFSPLKEDKNLSDRPFIDWNKVEVELLRLGII